MNPPSFPSGLAVKLSTARRAKFALRNQKQDRIISTQTMCPLLASALHRTSRLSSEKGGGHFYKQCVSLASALQAEPAFFDVSCRRWVCGRRSFDSCTSVGSIESKGIIETSFQAGRRAVDSSQFCRQHGAGGGSRCSLRSLAARRDFETQRRSCNGEPGRQSDCEGGKGAAAVSQSIGGGAPDRECQTGAQNDQPPW